MLSWVLDHCNSLSSLHICLGLHGLLEPDFAHRNPTNSTRHDDKDQYCEDQPREFHSRKPGEIRKAYKSQT